MRKILTFILISLVAGCASTTKETTKVEVADEYSGPEKLNFVVPKGWGVAHQAQNDSGAILELISNIKNEWEVADLPVRLRQLKLACEPEILGTLT